LTIGERNKKMNMSRAAEWITVVCMPPVFIFGTCRTPWPPAVTGDVS
jgi:hypothetical protein